MFLQEVKLERFKAAFIPNPVPLDEFNVIIGRNGSGKSTLLEALQWLDATIRRDAREACDRYFGSSDLINLRSRTKIPYFKLELKWGEKGCGPRWRYNIQVADRDGLPEIAEENLCSLLDTGYPDKTYIKTVETIRRVSPSGDSNTVGEYAVREPDRVALSRAMEFGGDIEKDPSFLKQFWEGAVFLRLSPNRLAHGSPTTRKSFEPILDEEGQTLPALLNELDNDQRQQLVQDIREILPSIRGVETTGSKGRDAQVHYNLQELMPYRGRTGKSQFPIPAWMLSEGTRRITAILALLCREPRPSLLCIEEVENGLDPWTVRAILKHLESAADEGVQVIVTTHSPWVLDEVSMKSILHVRREDGTTQYERFAENTEVLAFDDSIPAGTRYVNMEEE